MGSDVCACVVLEWCVARDASGNVVVFFFLRLLSGARARTGSPGGNVGPLKKRRRIHRCGGLASGIWGVGFFVHRTRLLFARGMQTDRDEPRAKGGNAIHTRWSSAGSESTPEVSRCPLGFALPGTAPCWLWLSLRVPRQQLCPGQREGTEQPGRLTEDRDAASRRGTREPQDES